MTRNTNHISIISGGIMFVVLAYDVGQKRVGKVMKICRKYLVHIQKSVFEGVVTQAKLNKLKNELEKVIDYDNDAICIYSTIQPTLFHKEQIGVVEENSSII